MRKLVFILFALTLITCDSIKFKEQALYDKYELPVSEEESEHIFFTEGTGTMWNSLFNCGNFEVSNKVAYEGKSSIKLDWNKANCEWIGFGNSFNNWQPIDLSELRFRKALSFYVRTQEKTANAIPIVANLEDYAGGGSYYFIDAGKYLNGLVMDTTWKQIIVPLWHFPIFEDEVDIYSIKQMKFQLEGGGAFFLDEIRIIDYSKEEYDKMRAGVELMRPKGNANQTVYRKGNFEEDVWGYESNECQTLAEEISNSNSKQIHWIYNANKCNWAKWGINWNGWYAMNLRGISETSKIYFKLKSKPDSKFKVMLEDFKYHKTELFSSENPGVKLEDGWVSVTIPLKNLNLKQKGFALDQIKQIYFEGTGEGELFIDEIKIIK